MNARPEWMTCVASKDPKRACCGRNLAGVFAFVSWDHADEAVRAGSRLIPCPDCLARREEQA